MKWLITLVKRIELPHDLRDAVDDAADQALHLGVDRLGLVEVVNDGESYLIMRKEDFCEWFGD